MEVFRFDKSVMERYEDWCMALKFSDSIVSAAKIHSAWQYYLSLILEPAGWQALWSLSRPFCEELQIRYPTVVFGTVDQIDFTECKAQFRIEAVQDEDVDLLLATHFINLEELWPTVRQENSAINVEKTAEALDNYRFFINQIWMPFDADHDDESIDFIETHFLSRAQLYCDMKNKRMSRQSAGRLKLLVSEARDIALKRNRLENEFLSDCEDDEEEEEGGDVPMKNSGANDKRKELLQLNMRLNQIKTDYEVLENPKMRRVYEETQEQQLWGSKKALQVNNVIVTKPGPVQEQIDYLTAVQSILGKDENAIVRPSLQDALNTASASDCIFIPHSVQAINYPLAMEDGGCIKALPDDQLKAIVASTAEDQHLFVCGNYRFEQLTLDCRNVDIGVLVKPGATVTLQSCVIVGGKQASTNQGICVRDGGKLVLENCRFEDHSTGVSARMGSQLVLRGCTFANCTTGLDLSESCSVSLENVTFEDGEEEKKEKRSDCVFGIILETNKVPEGKSKEVYRSFEELPSLPGLQLTGTNKGSVCLVKRFLDDGHVILE